MNAKPTLARTSLAASLLSLLLLPALPGEAQAQWNYTTAGGVITITQYTGPGGNVTIPDTLNGLPVTSIEDGAFYGCASLNSVTIPMTVKRIGAWVFENCTSLTSVRIGKSVTSIGNAAFYGCFSLGNVTIPNSVTNLGDGTFSGCASLNSVTIGNSVTSLGSAVFYGCSSLMGVTIPKSVTSIGDRAFALCAGLNSITIPNSVTNLGDGAFSDCGNLSMITIPTSVTRVGAWVFENCVNLWSVTIPSSVTSVGDDAFANCRNLSSVTLGNNLTTIGAGAFASCARLNSLTLPNSVTSIGDAAFSDCANLTTVTIPTSVRRIGASVFEDCTSLQSVTVPNSVTSIGDDAFNNCMSLASVALGDNLVTIGAGAFEYCANLWSVTIPDRVTTIGDEAFEYCNSLHDVTMGNSVSSIGAWAFDNCGNLTSVTMGTNVTTLGEGAFGYCPRLDNITIPESVTTLGDWAFDSCGSLASVRIGHSVTNLGDGAFEYCASLRSITLPDSVTTLGAWAFESCVNLTNVTMGKHVTTIGDGAFDDCMSLNSLTLPSSVTTIGDGAFDDCASLRGVYCQGNAPSVGSYAFDGDGSATVYYVPGTTGWSTTFGGCPTGLWDPQVPCAYTTSGGKVTITRYIGMGGPVILPDTINGLPVSSIGNSAFAGCSGLTSITLPNSLTSLGDGAFYSCTSLRAVCFQGNAPAIGWDVFAGDDMVVVYYLPETTGWDTSFAGRSTGLWNPQVPCTYSTNNGTVTLIQYTGSGGDVIIPDTIAGLPVASIGDFAFSGCTGLTNVTIPKTVTSIGNLVFSGCPSLRAITVDAGNSAYRSVDGVLFDKSQTTLLQCPGGKTESYTIPNGVTSIASWAFDHCTGLSSVTLASSVTSIGDGAFYFCTGLTAVYFQGNAPSLGWEVFLGDGDATGYYLPGSTGWSSWFGHLPTALWVPCTYTTNNGTITITGYTGFGGALIIPDTINGLLVTSIGNAAFQSCTSLITVTIPNTLTSIGAGAFSGCSSLFSLTIGNGVISLGAGAFSSCTNLTALYFQGDAPSVGLSAFTGDNHATVYYLPGTMGWDANFGGLPTALWPASPGDFSYTTDSGVITITGYNGSGGVVVIPFTINGLPVTRIGDHAFGFCSSLTSVTIPGSITSIGQSAFYYCSSLANLTIPGSVSSIGNAAFYRCTSLTDLTIPDAVTSIGAGAFYGCSSLSAITVDALNSAYSSADGILFNKNRTTLLQYPAGRAGSYTVPDSVTSIGSDAFAGCSGLRSIILPSGLTSIESEAFYHCSSLGAICFEGNPPAIGWDVFSGDYMAVVCWLPGTTGWDTSFGGCPTGLWNPQVPCIYRTNNGTVTLIQYIGPGGKVIIPDTIAGLPVTSLGDFAFSGCTGLASVTIPGSVTTLGDAAFYHCTSLMEVCFLGNAPSLGSSVFEGDPMATVYYLAGTTGWNSTFGGLPTALWDLGVPVGLQFMLNSGTITITGYAGAGGAITIPTTIASLPVTTIASFAFQGSANLTSVTISSSVTNIGDVPFRGCPALTAITVDALNSVYSSLDGVLLNKSQTALIEYPGGRTEGYTIPSSVGSIGDRAFEHCANLTSVMIGDSVTSIGYRAFSGCASLASVAIGSHVTSIRPLAFLECTTLTAITVAAGNPAFSSADGVLLNKNATTLITYPAGKTGEFTIPNGVTGIASMAFAECANLTSVTIPSSVTIIGACAFSVCTNLASVNLGNGVTSIEYQTFWCCVRLAAITIPASVTNLGNEAFYGCARLTEVHCEGNAPSLGSSVFYGTPAIVYYLPMTTGWDRTFGGRPTALWNPLAPRVAVVAPFANDQIISTNPVTIQVQATAGSGLGVSAVFVAVDGSGFVPASFTNPNWSIDWPVDGFLPGTNLIQVYALDSAGHLSPTNNIQVVWVMVDLLRLFITGQGSVAPISDGQLLEIGRSYAVTATGTNGFTFSYWLLSTDQFNDVAMVTSSRLDFTMLSNLSLRAVFVDTTRPTVTISNLANNQQVSNTLFSARGTASDNAGVSNVWYQLNGMGWNLAAGTNPWAAMLPLAAGTNRFQVFAEDFSGNRSMTNPVSFICVVTDLLRVEVVGPGRVAPWLDSQMLEIGRGYTITASGIDGAGFLGWTLMVNGAVLATSPDPCLNFVMQTNLVLVANFGEGGQPPPPPVIITQPLDQLCTVGDTVRFEVEGDICSQPNSFQWQFNESDIPDATNAILTLANVQASNAGRYRALVGNANGTATSSNALLTVRLPVSGTLAIASPLSLVSGQFQFNLLSDPGCILEVQASTNLLQWTPIATLTLTNGTALFSDPVTNLPSRFYRLKQVGP